jgi:hypothetical protein
MDLDDPAAAQRVVADYAALLEQHAQRDVYPASIDSLPYPKETIKAAIRISVEALTSSGQMTGELRDFLEIAYVSTADYIDGELVRLLAEFTNAGQTLTTGPRLASERMASRSWEVLAESGRLAGEIARTIADEAGSLREEFRRFAGEP